MTQASITCPRCGATSHNPNDVREGYCGRCHDLTRDAPCAFCEITEERAPATVVRRWVDALAIVPLNPVTEGHVLVMPWTHVPDAAAHPVVTGVVMQRAAELAGMHEAANIITSIGAAATQTVMHLHVHVVPRRPGDGLALPWTGQQPASVPVNTGGPLVRCETSWGAQHGECAVWLSDDTLCSRRLGHDPEQVPHRGYDPSGSGRWIEYDPTGRETSRGGGW